MERAATRFESHTASSLGLRSISKGGLYTYRVVHSLFFQSKQPCVCSYQDILQNIIGDHQRKAVIQVVFVNAELLSFQIHSNCFTNSNAGTAVQVNLVQLHDVGTKTNCLKNVFNNLHLSRLNSTAFVPTKKNGCSIFKSKYLISVVSKYPVHFNM